VKIEFNSDANQILAQRAVRAHVPSKGLARAVCVVCDDSGHKPKLRWWKVVAHSIDDEQFGAFNVSRRVIPSFRRNQWIVGPMQHQRRSTDVG
jgi:hypothetical protein